MTSYMPLKTPTMAPRLIERIYLSGPMTGLPEFNYPAFNAEAARLRAIGYHVENPAENHTPPCGSWGGYMRQAIRQMLTCDAVALLPGWAESRGATVERDLAIRIGLLVVPASKVTALDGPGSISQILEMQTSLKAAS